MAVWQFEMTGLEVTGHDDYGWPVTQIVNLVMTVEEDSFIRLHRTAHHIAREEFPNCCAIIINSYDRIDKRTGKDYPEFNDSPEKLTYHLNKAQAAALAQLKDKILREITRDSKNVRQPSSLLGLGDPMACYIADDIAWLWHYGGILTHDEAQATISAIQEFYTRITPEKLAVLRMRNDIGLSHDELLLIRSFNIKVK